MYVVDDNLQEFVEAGVATIVGTGDESGRPQVAYGWGPRVKAGSDLVDVFLDKARADKTLANLRANGKIAVTFADPVSYRSVQLKGVFKEAAEPDDADRDWVRRGREAFVATTSLIGDPALTIRNMWMDEVMCVRFRVERAFDQTPGPQAGRPL